MHQATVPPSTTATFDARCSGLFFSGCATRRGEGERVGAIFGEGRGDTNKTNRYSSTALTAAGVYSGYCTTWVCLCKLYVASLRWKRKRADGFSSFI